MLEHNFNDLLQRKNFTSYHVWLRFHVLTITYRSIAHIVIETFSEQLWRVSEVRNRAFRELRFPPRFFFFGEAGRLNASATNSGFRNTPLRNATTVVPVVAATT